MRWVDERAHTLVDLLGALDWRWHCRPRVLVVVRGLLRVHQFEKVEQFVLCAADEEESAR